MKIETYEYLEDFFSDKKYYTDDKCRNLMEEEGRRIADILAEWNRYEDCDRTIARLLIPKGTLLASSIMLSGMSSRLNTMSYLSFEYDKTKTFMDLLKFLFMYKGIINDGIISGNVAIMLMYSYTGYLVSYFVRDMCGDDSFDINSDYQTIDSKYLIPLRQRYIETINISPPPFNLEYESFGFDIVDFMIKNLDRYDSEDDCD